MQLQLSVLLNLHKYHGRIQDWSSYSDDYYALNYSALAFPIKQEIKQERHKI